MNKGSVCWSPENSRIGFVFNFILDHGRCKVEPNRELGDFKVEPVEEAWENII